MDGAWGVMLAAAGVAFFHTLLGPDHSLPFVMLARSRGWSMRRTLTVTLACGLGHVVSSLLLGTLGIVLGYGVGQLEGAEAARGSWAAWALVAFGLAYAAWGLRRALRRKSGVVLHHHGRRVHLHRHGDQPHDHAGDSDRASTASFWTLFAVFVLGPCEPLIPLFMVPASTGDWGLALGTAGVFTLVTLATMVGVVALGVAGLQSLRLAWLERWAEPLAGGVIAASGAAILHLGL